MPPHDRVSSHIKKAHAKTELTALQRRIGQRSLVA